jgi:sugar phosphate isomerase/epimerase
VNRRSFLGWLSMSLLKSPESLSKFAGFLPANRNIKWALSAGLWSYYPQGSFTDILDVMRDTGFIGIRLAGYPDILKTYKLTTAQLEREVSKRNLQVVTISFGETVNDPTQHQKIVAKARESMKFLQAFGARHLVVFPPARMKPGTDVDAGFRAMCQGFNRIGEAAREMGFQAGVHNHLGQMVEGPSEVDRCMQLTDPKLFNFAPDTAHLHLGGSNVAEMYEKYIHRLIFMDYKDARMTMPKGDVVMPNGTVLPKNSNEAKFMESIYDLGDGDIDFSACHRVLRGISWKGWICVDLDRTRYGPRTSYERCGKYVVSKLEPIYL